MVGSQQKGFTVFSLSSPPSFLYRFSTPNYLGVCCGLKDGEGRLLQCNSTTGIGVGPGHVRAILWGVSCP